MIRRGLAGDAGAVVRLHRLAFPDEDLTGLVGALLGRDEVLALVAVEGDAVVGSVLFTRCAVAGSPARADLMGPVAVVPDRQGRGIGGALIRAGLAELKAAGSAVVLVLGDPRYYGRFGFAAETALDPPHPLPEAYRGAWQSLVLGGAVPAGRLVVPEPWQAASLWGP